MKAVSYLRCSGETQIKGDTWARQQAAIVKYCLQNGIELVQEFRDEGITGKMELENRHGLSDCIRFVTEQNIKTVIVEDATRLARDLIVAEVCIREFQRAGVRVISASGGVDLTAGDESNPTAKLVRQILSAVAEFDRCVITLKLRSAKERKRLSDPSWRDGKKPYGMKPGEEAVLASMRDMRNQGLLLHEITQRLNDGNCQTRNGGKWTLGTVAKILARR